MRKEFITVNHLSSGTGTEPINCGACGDTYYFNVSDGADTIVEYANSTDHTCYGGNQNKVVFGTTITKEELWSNQSGNDLVINVALYGVSVNSGEVQNLAM